MISLNMVAKELKYNPSNHMKVLKDQKEYLLPHKSSQLISQYKYH